jgi:hypothetical protein
MDVAFLVLLEYLLKQFSFGYRSPVVYTALIALVVVVSLGFAIDRATDINDHVLERADENDLPFPFGDFYEHAHRPLPPGLRPQPRLEVDEIIMRP